jgi:hypothetical protein
MEAMIRPFKRMRFEEQQIKTNEFINHVTKIQPNIVINLNRYPNFIGKRKFNNVNTNQIENSTKIRKIDIMFINAAIKIQKIYRGWTYRRRYRLIKFPFYST